LLSPEEEEGNNYDTLPTTASTASTSAAAKPKSYDENRMYDIDIDFINIVLQKIEKKTLHCNCFTTTKDVSTESDLCTIFRSRAQLVDLDRDQQDSNSDSTEFKSPAICIELVGSRFLRCMVRIIISTVIRESFLDKKDRRSNILLNCCASGSRHNAALPINGKGLSLCGVGYTIERSLQHGANAVKVKQRLIESGNVGTNAEEDLSQRRRRTVRAAKKRGREEMNKDNINDENNDDKNDKDT